MIQHLPLDTLHALPETGGGVGWGGGMILHVLLATL